MAAVWEFTIVSKNGVPFESLNQMIQEYGNDINVVAAFSIDDWRWSNQQRLESVEEIKEKLDKGKIITVEIQSKKWKSLCVYIEKKEAYIYTFWINTEGVAELDSDQIINANQKYYNQAYHILDSIIKKYDIPFDYIAIGLESDVYYCTDIKRAISRSSNVIIWLIKSDSDICLAERIERHKVSEKLDCIIFNN